MSLTSALVLTSICSLAIQDRADVLSRTELWGRGYTDTPLDVPHDSRLFTMQIFFGIASSSLSWTGAASGGFSVIGFSLGGGITMAFAAHFPYLINSIILLAPGGILRNMPEDYESILFRHASFIPGKYIRRAVGRLLGVTLLELAQKLGTDLNNLGSGPQVVKDTASVGKQNLDVAEIVKWQFDHHKGFCHSFVDTIRYGPITNQESDWRKVCDLIKDKESPSDKLHADSKLRNSKLLVIFGKFDDLVVADDVLTDLTAMLGGYEHLEYKIVPGGHGFPVPNCDEIVGHICEFWHM